MSVTFVGKVETSEGEEQFVKNLTVEVFSQGGNLVFRDEFALGAGGYEPTYVDLPPATYYVNARADGYRFPWRTEVEIEDEVRQVVEIEGVSTKKDDQPMPCLVYGWIQQAAPTMDTGKAAPSHMASRYVGFPGKGYRTERAVFFTKLTEEDSVGVMLRESLTVGYDRNGFFSVELHPETWYEVSYHGRKSKFKTPAEGQERDLKTLVKKASRMFLYDIR